MFCSECISGWTWDKMFLRSTFDNFCHLLMIESPKWYTKDRVELRYRLINFARDAAVAVTSASLKSPT